MIDKTTDIDQTLAAIDRREAFQLRKLAREEAHVRAKRAKLDWEIDEHISKFLALQQDQNHGIAGAAIKKCRIKTKEFFIDDQKLETNDTELEVIRLKKELIETEARNDRRDVEIEKLMRQIDEMESMADRKPYHLPVFGVGDAADIGDQDGENQIAVGRNISIPSRASQAIVIGIDPILTRSNLAITSDPLLAFAALEEAPSGMTAEFALGNNQDLEVEAVWSIDRRDFGDQSVENLNLPQFLFDEDTELPGNSDQ